MKFTYLTLILALISITSYSQELVKDLQAPFQPGEHLHYKLHYGLFTAAEADLRLEDSPVKFDGKAAYHIIADGKTNGTFDFFYKVRNRYESFLDINTLLPYQYKENRREGKYRHTDDITFDHDNNKITASKGVYPFTGQIFDFPSAYYFARCLDMSRIKVGDKLVFHYFLEDKIETLTITYLGKEVAECSLGKFECLKFTPSIIPGSIFRKDSKFYLWVTNDKNRIPIRAQAEVILGSLTMELSDAKGLKYPLNKQ
ncbi:DUF3108 domain-containing protein [Mucilaginibacter sp. HMF5004]|uniref:DUF3108 domain-containing protein n=1 Tax=Mucilaginibacter rivuli TaxID=2857527 RepID=UPI001C5D9429|nr:DUF3108 domain-containing protein [Mucilaginibacter rivuli]MBW4888605.1 DUF3108 domain-containing protein [Mucilaginibacter rivuli]